MQLGKSDWDYVDERASGFTGRGWVFERVRAFLAAPDSTLLLCGPPGSGKTAVAARLAQASVGRDGPADIDLPMPAGTLDAAVFCRAGRVDLLDVAQRLSAQLATALPGFELEQAAALASQVYIRDVQVETGDVSEGADVTGVRIALDRLGPDRAFSTGVALPLRRLADRGRSRPAALLVDALDEALTTNVARDLPRLLGELVGVKLIATARDDPRVTAQLGDSFTPLHLLDDAPPETDDVLEYVSDQLSGHGPNAGMHALARRIAEEADGNFLYCSYVAQALIKSGVLAGLDEKGAKRIPLPPGGLPGVYRDFLRRELTRDEAPWSERFRPILAPLAVALGDGLTTTQLAMIGSRLAHRSVSRSDARDVTRIAGQFLEGRKPDGPFRPYHQSFAEFLTDPDQNPDWLVDETEAHEAIAAALLEEVRKGEGMPGRILSADREFAHAHTEPVRKTLEGGLPNWFAAHAYTREYLARHLAAANMLDEHLDDPGFLLSQELRALLRALRSSASAPAIRCARIVDTALPNLHGTREQAAAGLEMAARQAAHNELADRVDELELDKPWKTLWAQWQVGSGRLVGNHVGEALALAVTTLGRLSVVISGGEDGTVRVWDLETSSPVTDPFIGHHDAVTTVAVGELAGRAVIVSGGVDGTVRRWDLEMGRSLGDPLIGHDGPVLAVAVGKLAGRAVVVSGGDDHAVRRWDLETGRSLGVPFIGHNAPVLAVAVGELAERPVIVSGDEYGTVRRWDMETGRRIGNRLVRQQESGESFAVAVGQFAGRPFVASGGARIVRWWDMKTARPLGEPLVSPTAEHDVVAAVTLGELEGRAVVVSGGSDWSVRAWDVETGSLVSERFVEHDVKAIAWSELVSGPVAISAGHDGTVLLSEMAATGSAGTDRLTSYPVSAIAIRERAGQRVVVSGGADGMLRRWDTETGRLLGNPITGHEGSVSSIAVVELPATSLIVSGGSDGMVRRWDLETGSLLGELLARRENAWSRSLAIAVVEIEGRLVVATDTDEGVCLWDVKTGRLVRQLDVCRCSWAVRSWPHALAIGKIEGRSVVVSGGAQAGTEVVTHGRTQVHYYTEPIGTVCRWDMMTGSPLGEPLTCQNGQIWAVAAGDFEDTPVVVAGGDDTLVRIWNMKTGAPLCEPLAGHRAPVMSVALGACASRPVILSGDSIGTVRVRELDNTTRLVIDTGAKVTGLAATAHPGVAIATAHGLMLCTWK